MNKITVSKLILVSAIASTLLLNGCAATSMAIENHDVSVHSAMSKTIFLPMTAPADKTFAIDVHNSSDVEVGSGFVKTDIEQALLAKGYREVSSDQAHFQVQLNIVSSGYYQQSAGGGMPGAIAGAAVGGINNGGQGALAGAVVGGLLDTVAGALVKLKMYNLICQLQIGVKQNGAVISTQQVNDQQGTSGDKTQTVTANSQFVEYQTQVTVSASQVNLEIKDALPAIQNALVRNVSGLF